MRNTAIIIATLFLLCGCGSHQTATQFHEDKDTIHKTITISEPLETVAMNMCYILREDLNFAKSKTRITCDSFPSAGSGRISVEWDDKISTWYFLDASLTAIDENTTSADIYFQKAEAFDRCLRWIDDNTVK